MAPYAKGAGARPRVRPAHGSGVRHIDRVLALGPEAASELAPAPVGCGLGTPGGKSSKVSQAVDSESALQLDSRKRKKKPTKIQVEPPKIPNS